MPKRTIFCLFLAILALSMSGCTSLSSWWKNGAKVGPNYKGVRADVANAWQKTEADVDVTPGTDEKEPRMLLPQQQQMAAANQTIQNSENTIMTKAGMPLYQTDWQLNVGLSWEADFWGRFRRMVEAADAGVEASHFDYANVKVLLQSDLVGTYLLIRSLEERLAIVEWNGKVQVRLAKALKMQAGPRIPESIGLQAESEVEFTRSILPVLKQARVQAINKLAVLLGTPPSKDFLSKLYPKKSFDELAAMQKLLARSPNELIPYPKKLAKDDWVKPPESEFKKVLDYQLPKMPTEIAIGIPADLVRRRPDVRAAERKLAAQSAKRGIAEAEFYPHIGINGKLGYNADHCSDFLDATSFAGNIGPFFQWNILNYGRIEANVNAENAVYYQAAFAYRDAVLKANQEAEDAIASYLASAQSTASLEAGVEKLRDAVRLLQIRLYMGAADNAEQLSILMALRGLLLQEISLAENRFNRAISVVKIYKAVGGGW